ncbi:hypothetical protein QGN29_13980 [Temperatibacter marinus]|uniref:Uncharacterized protein n=1 Tax=Temperatibacter marinus TaxID=1456591 RepID=A0AA52EC43_9PROT|nr:hypothetical protein [Temperatibacter marinus]WND02657.1 hypothetical protein QGN29_13980 [Temperatibacter marinus]
MTKGTANHPLSSFYVRMGFLFILLILIGFVPTVFEKYSTDFEFSSALIVHSVCWTLWYILFVIQAGFIGSKNYVMHKKIGILSLLLVGLMAISMLLVIPESYARGVPDFIPFTAHHFIMLPILDATLMPLFFFMAYLTRKQADVHKHFMLMTCIVLLDPAVGRIGNLLDFPPLGLLLHFGLLALVCLYDRRQDEKIHWVTKLGISALVLRYAVFFILGPTQFWADLMGSLFSA